MKRIIVYSAVLLILIGFEGLVTMGDAFNWDNYTFIGWVAQALILLLCLGASEYWSRQWIEEDK
jgi:uncharacterized membrane protein